MLLYIAFLGREELDCVQEKVKGSNLMIKKKCFPVLCIVANGTRYYKVLLVLSVGFGKRGDILMDSRSFITGQDSPFEIDLNLQASTSHNCLA